MPEKRTYYCVAEGDTEGAYFRATQSQQAVYQFAVHLAYADPSKRYVGRVFCRNATLKTVAYDCAIYVDAIRKRLSGGVSRSRNQACTPLTEEEKLSLPSIHPTLDERERLLSMSYSILDIPAAVLPCGQCVQYANRVRISIPCSSSEHGIGVYLTWSELQVIAANGGKVGI